jgi:glutathionyl-hydroquinone reductase
MGDLIQGVWRADGDFPHDGTGHFVRPDAPFRNWVTADGSAGPSGAGGFRAEPGRYHLIVSLACPWAHRTLIFRKLKGLEGTISLSVVHWLLGERGWTFEQGRRHRARPLGQKDGHDRQQRIV